MTPTREQIEAKALELYYNDLTRSGINPDTTPTTEELKESGFWMLAQNELLRNTDEYRVFLEREVNETRLPQIHDGLLFDWKTEVKKSNILISGTNSTGKTRLACALVSTLLNLGWQVIAFDNSGVWQKISDIPLYIEIEKMGYGYEIPILESQSVIYDISQLIPEQQKQLVDFVLLDLWSNRYTSNIQWVMVALEEFELYGRNIRGQVAQNMLRLFHAGRNRQVRNLAITTDLALIDPSFIRLCQQRYHARLGIESNSKRRFKSYYGKDWMLTATQLETGKFIYLNKNNLQLISVPMFEAKRQPISYEQYLASLQPAPKPKRSFWDKLLERVTT